MSQFRVTLSVKDMFFDRARVLKEIGRENAQRLSKAGAFIRQRAKSKLKRRGGTGKQGRNRKGQFTKGRSATAGQPPIVHSRDARANLRFILFGLDTDWESVVIGPVGLPNKRLRGSNRQTVPELMEFGGTAQVGRKKKRGRYAKHPFMGPSLDEEVAAGKIGRLWRGR